MCPFQISSALSFLLRTESFLFPSTSPWLFSRVIDWKERWFVFNNQRLYYYRTKEHQSPIDSIDIKYVAMDWLHCHFLIVYYLLYYSFHNCYLLFYLLSFIPRHALISETQGRRFDEFLFEINTPHRTYYMRARSEKDMVCSCILIVYFVIYT